ncbi:CPBP family intramembrane glutamic endopeptidase [Latilactobacillus sakei]|uniref:CPBP family intramembrane glutamic endopeptidase n=1 Tax=Latilactobacillus sakei TaxID=1599 RepID=UPI000DC648E6|nr:type II CAAX endopeptidase family protein [Latilactobacillus sakei]SPS04055.1 CAAX amino terminal protease self- immunity [Latilactobacillus sakei]
MKVKPNYSTIWTVIGFFIVYQLLVMPEILLMSLNNKIVTSLSTLITLVLAVGFINYTFKYVSKIAYWQNDFVKRNSYTIFTVSVLLILLVQWGDSFLIAHGVLSNTQNQSENIAALNRNPIFMLVFGLVIAPILEELIFRGLFYKSLLVNLNTSEIKQRSLTLMIAVNTLIFTLPHLQTFSLEILPYIIMLVIFSVNFIYYKKISVPIILHIFNNLIAIFLF